ncbi:MAG: hypothetical protein ACI9BD_001341 [Candidatus Marinamargulisbacteria bacterium]|jgi:hypothetical protein
MNKIKLLLPLILLAFLTSPSFSEPSLYDLDRLKTRQQQTLRDFRLSNRYFTIYLNKDIGRAKTLYLYLTKKLEAASDNHENAESILAELPDYELGDGQSIFENNVSAYVEIQKIYTETQSRLRERYAAIDQLKESAVFIETDYPLIDVIEGRLDSDFDGIPDHIELSDGQNSPLTGTDISHF